MPRRSLTVLLINVAVVLALLVVMLGGWTRINDAGLGCPDWPGCYGHIVLPGSEQALAEAQALYPDQPLLAAKGWLEMVHRYAASSLGLLMLALAWLGWKRRRDGRYPTRLSIALLCLVCLQGAFGMWTVTLKLLPLVVTLHLLGGLAILSFLVLLRFRILRWQQAARLAPVHQRQGKGWITLATLVLFGQIALGGWTSANYAGWACTDWLQCERGGGVSLDFATGFTPALETGPNYQGGHMPRDARAAVQMTHRAGAVLVLLVVGVMTWRLRKAGWPRAPLITIGLLVVLQIALGIANIIYAVPIPLAMAHHGGAVVLLLSLVWLSQQDLVVDKEAVYACAQSC
ncbi:COX15/CtaA family protein [Marinobacterium rhizophilum]|uniref:COX15/CtaA family protein n=1 Tax=Marinobacterium rhizophilum TaxID=420402 RepID=A0ABY5HIP8_9GAMM|nr:COX15/CtaA family protein [Marinobacterium rhizophilum]UTW11135.1 COX15/CtaA family protein [Marinobacterium rhizophilum]